MLGLKKRSRGFSDKQEHQEEMTGLQIEERDGLGLREVESAVSVPHRQEVLVEEIATSLSRRVFDSRRRSPPSFCQQFLSS